MSLGHFMVSSDRLEAVIMLRSASLATTPAKGERLGNWAGCRKTSNAHENIRLAPDRFCQLRPERPRPRSCRWAPSSQGLARTPDSARARSIRSALVEEIGRAHV